MSYINLVSLCFIVLLLIRWIRPNSTLIFFYHRTHTKWFNVTVSPLPQPTLKKQPACHMLPSIHTPKQPFSNFTCSLFSLHTHMHIIIKIVTTVLLQIYGKLDSLVYIVAGVFLLWLATAWPASINFLESTIAEQKIFMTVPRWCIIYWKSLFPKLVLEKELSHIKWSF